jgi:hypothetical protein
VSVTKKVRNAESHGRIGSQSLGKLFDDAKAIEILSNDRSCDSRRSDNGLRGGDRFIAQASSTATALLGQPSARCKADGASAANHDAAAARDE